jgi:hypothetical protein
LHGLVLLAIGRLSGLAAWAPPLLRWRPRSGMTFAAALEEPGGY